MSVRSLFRPLPVVQVDQNNVANGALVMTPEPKQVATIGANGQGDAYLKLTFPSQAEFDSVFVGFSSGGDKQIEIWSRESGVTEKYLGPPIAALPTGIAGGRRHYLLQLAQPVSAVGLSIYARAVQAPFTIGVVAAGLAFRPEWGGEFGGGVGLTDTGGVSRRRDGGFGIDEGVTAAQLQWIFGDLSDVERAQLFALLRERGTSRPAIVIEGEDTGPMLTEEVHYGLFTRIEAYERFAPGMSRWALRFEAWE